MGTETSYFSETDIDFEEFQIIASFDYLSQGLFMDLEILSVIENADNRVIDILYTEAEENSCFGFTGESFRQYYIIKIPKSPKPITFTSSTVIPACPEGSLAVGKKRKHH